ncbi:FKBP-type peptidyl-prolyl cis-trans isomerase [Azohydromonas sediminis]|uniref:FKBP-type peptidyl-prolyl cis-trans isomerase n=1 Tax=Azohydromonas sediminis TaxID=2259674 RepID=UPI000E64846D|nr:peptidylprolyl isomerase [Azohydromonas sediminis]
MRITAPCVVSLTWTLSNAQNQPIDELTAPVEFFFGGDDLLPQVEEALAGHAVGDEIRLQLEPQHAFGDYDPALVCFEARALFPDNVAPGMSFEGLPEGATTQGMPRDRVYTVTEVYPEHVVLDGNHPLAGMALRLHIKVRDVREATAAEIEARSVGTPDVSVLPVAPSSATRH